MYTLLSITVHLYNTALHKWFEESLIYHTGHCISSLYLSTSFVTHLFEFVMPRLSLGARKRFVILFKKRVSVSDIHKSLEEETSFSITKQTLNRLIQKFKRDRVIVDPPRRKRPSEMLEMIDSALKQNDKLSSQQLGN